MARPVKATRLEWMTRTDLAPMARDGDFVAPDAIVTVRSRPVLATKPGAFQRKICR